MFRWLAAVTAAAVALPFALLRLISATAAPSTASAGLAGGPSLRTVTWAAPRTSADNHRGGNTMTLLAHTLAAGGLAIIGHAPRSWAARLPHVAALLVGDGEDEVPGQAVSIFDRAQAVRAGPTTRFAAGK